jgi:hypothetical protein
MEAWPRPRRGEWPDLAQGYSTSNGGGCVEVASAPGAGIAVRDSKDPDGPRLDFTAGDWRAFLRRVKDGQLA